MLVNIFIFSLDGNVIFFPVKFADETKFGIVNNENKLFLTWSQSSGYNLKKCTFILPSAG